MPKVLIVDDEQTIRMLFQYTLGDAGYEVETACDGQDAIAKLSGFLPDLILLDISMPVMTGPEFAKNLEIKSYTNPNLRRIPFIVMTGENYMDPNNTFGFEKYPNFQCYLPKMTSPDDVVALIGNILSTGNKN